MVPIPLSSLKPGIMTEKEYFTQDGELLLSRGVMLTHQHVDALLRRKIDIVYMRDNEGDNELQKILNADFVNLDDLGIDDLQNNIESDYCAGVKNPILAGILPGREGFEQLLAGKKLMELDKIIQDSGGSDVPAGISLKSRSKEITAKERTSEYKAQQLSTYEESVDRTKRIMNGLASGVNISASSIQSLVERFIDTYLTDRNMLLNLSSIKAEDGDYLYHHSLNVCIIAINIAAASGFSEQQVIEIGMGSLMHDVGMLLIPKTLRMKNGRLDESELFEIQKHPMLGLHLLEKVTHLPIGVSFVAYQTHERENGRGYPKQRGCRFINNYAKVTAVADIFEALSSPRVYREQNIPYKTMEILVKMARQGLLSSNFVKAFLEYTSLFPVGSVVELSNGYIARVVKANGNSFAKPVVCVFADVSGMKLDDDEVYEEDLAKNTVTQIVRAYSSAIRTDIMLGF